MTKKNNSNSNGNTIGSIIEAQTNAKATGKQAETEPKAKGSGKSHGPKYTKEDCIEILETLGDSSNVEMAVKALAVKLGRTESSVSQKYYILKRQHADKVQVGSAEIRKEKFLFSQKENWMRIVEMLYGLEIPFEGIKGGIRLLEAEMIREDRTERKQLAIKLINLGCQFIVGTQSVTVYGSTLDLESLRNDPNIK